MKIKAKKGRRFDDTHPAIDVDYVGRMRYPHGRFADRCLAKAVGLRQNIYVYVGVSKYFSTGGEMDAL